MSEMTVQEIKESQEPVLVDFYSDQCGPCRAMMPVLSEIEAAGHKVVKLNVYDNLEFAQEQGVSAVPTFVIFRGGEVVDTLVGMQSKQKLLSYLEANG